ncbi:MAG: ion channel, partial [Pseudomonadota bacterium]
RRVGAIHSIEAAVYYTLVTSTTLGYGDITLDRRWRTLGAMAAVTGLLIFGLSTAFLIELMSGLVTELPKPDVVRAV